MIGRNRADVWTELSFYLSKHVLRAGEQLEDIMEPHQGLRGVPGDECLYGILHNECLKIFCNRKALSLWLALNAGRKRGNSCVTKAVLWTRVGEGLRSDELRGSHPQWIVGVDMLHQLNC